MININNGVVTGVANKKLTSIVIPAKTTGIGYEAFAWCDKLKSVDIPSSVKSIGDFAFKGCESLTDVAVPVGVASIGKGVFFGCVKLASIVLPKTVKSIGYGAFFNCGSLTTVKYGGKLAEWNAVAKDPSWKSNSKIKTIVCSDGTAEV